MINLICLYEIDATLAFEEFNKLTTSSQISVIAALHRESLLNPRSTAAQLYDDLLAL